ncbi:MAG: metalloenzyme [Chloroflexi bacterium]|nr:metalloenzyme [Chloroflexota bacterium]
MINGIRPMAAHILLFFLDGVGIGAANPAINPWQATSLPALEKLLGTPWPSLQMAAPSSERASLAYVDANLGIEGLPQSGTGQTALITGVNAAALLGRHDGPYPATELRPLLQYESIYARVMQHGLTVAFANAYPDRYLGRVARGTSRQSAISLAARLCQIPLRTATDLRDGTALSALITNEGWRQVLGYTETPDITARQAGWNLGNIVASHALTVFELWQTDVLGHRQDMPGLQRLLLQIDACLGGFLEHPVHQETLVIVTSDHGNCEDLSTSRHTTNPVPLLVIGPHHQVVTAKATSILAVTPIILDHLQIGNRPPP